MDHSDKLLSAIERLKETQDVTVRAPADQGMIESLETVFDVELTPDVRWFYEQCDGATSDRLDGFIMSCDDILSQVENIAKLSGWPLAERFGLLPVVDLWDGYWWCVSQLEPMRGRVFYFSHDDIPHLKFRSLAEALDVWTDMAVSKDWETGRAIEQRNSYRDSLSRTEKERSDAKMMGKIALEFPGSGYPVTRHREYIIGMGLDLLAGDDLDIMANLLNTEYAEAAYRHMVSMNNEGAKQLARDWKTQNLNE